MQRRTFERNYLTREYEEVTAAENARTAGRKGNDFAILGLAEKKLLDGERHALLQGCIEAYKKGRHNAVDSFCLGTRAYILNAEDSSSVASRTVDERDAALALAPALFTARTARQLCDTLRTIAEDHSELAPMVLDTARMIAAAGGLTKKKDAPANEPRATF